MQQIMTKRGPLYTIIQEKLTQGLKPAKLVIVDESRMHRGHAGVQGAETSETHFNVEIVADAFHNVSRIQRQRMVNNILKEQFDSGLHALALTCKSPIESVE